MGKTAQKNDVKVFDVGFWEVFGRISDGVGIIGFLISLGIWARVDRFAKEVEQQRIKYAKRHSKIYRFFKAFRDNIQKDGLISPSMANGALENLYSMKRSLGKILSKGEISLIDNAIALIDVADAKTDINKIAKSINPILAIFKEEEL